MATPFALVVARVRAAARAFAGRGCPERGEAGARRRELLLASLVARLALRDQQARLPDGRRRSSSARCSCGPRRRAATLAARRWLGGVLDRRVAPPLPAVLAAVLAPDARRRPGRATTSRSARFLGDYSLHLRAPALGAARRLRGPAAGAARDTSSGPARSACSSSCCSRRRGWPGLALALSLAAFAVFATFASGPTTSAVPVPLAADRGGARPASRSASSSTSETPSTARPASASTRSSRPGTRRGSSSRSSRGSPSSGARAGFGPAPPRRLARRARRRSSRSALVYRVVGLLLAHRRLPRRADARRHALARADLARRRRRDQWLRRSTSGARPSSRPWALTSTPRGEVASRRSPACRPWSTGRGTRSSGAHDRNAGRATPS